MELGIIIALKGEFREFLALLPAPPTASLDLDTGQHDYVFEHPVTHHRCVVTLIGEMNPGPATLQTERLVSRWSPRTVVMLGIAAGIHSDVRVGDVVIASQVDNYLASAKAQPGSTGESFEFSLGGVVFHADHHLLTQVRNFEFSQPQAFSRWRRDCARVLAELVPDEEVRSALVRQGLVREAPDVLDAHLASDSVVGAAQQFTQWLRKQRDRNLKALDMESAGLMAAAVKRKEPVRTLVLRGVSDYGDERKSELDAVREGALRRYAMRNATRLLWELLEAGVLLPPEPGGGKASAGEAPFIGISSASLGEGFKGRERTLEQLHEQLRGAGEVALTSANAGRVFAHGGGGIGKSRLAIEYAYRYQAEYPGGVFFTRVEKRGPLEIWAEFARKVFTERSLPQDEEAALAFAQRLGDPNVGRQLIILDDVQADSRDELNRRFKGRIVVRGHAIWPVTQGTVSLLVTTRMRDISWARSFAVERLDAKAATELLVEKAGRAALAPEEQKAATHLAAEVLGGHPLALSLAGAYIGRGGFFFSEYLGLIREKGLTDQLEEAAKEIGSEIDDHERSIVATYALSRRQLDSGQPGDVLAGRLLRIAAFLEPGVPIDRKLLVRLLKARGDTSDMERIELALARLTKDLALLDLSQDGGAGPGSLIIHPLIGDYTRWGMQAREREELQQELLSGLLQLFPNSPDEFWRITGKDAYSDWEHLSAAREAHATAVWRAAKSTDSMAQIILSWMLGDLRVSRGNLSSAAECYQQALEIGKRLAEREPDNAEWQRDVSVSLERLGDVLQAQGDLAGARWAYEQALEIAKRLAEREPDNAGLQRDVSVSFTKLGEVLQARGDLEWARRAYEQALEIAKRLAEREPDNAGWQRDVSVSLERLGDVLQAQGDLAGARRAYEQALEIAKRLAEREPDNAGLQRDVSVSFTKLGEVLQARGDLEWARRAYEQALEIAKRLAEREPDNAGWQRDVSVSLERLGDVLQAQGNLAGARWAYEQTLEIAKRLAEREPDNAGWQRDVSVSLERLGEVLQAQGNLAGARRAYEQALEIAKRLAEREPDNAGWQRDVSVSLERLGDVLQAQGNLEGARRAYEQALESRRRLAEREPDNAMWQRDVSVSLNKLGDVLGEQSNLEGARRAYEQALESRQRLAEREPDNAGWQRDVSVSLGRLGDVFKVQGDLKEARRAYEQALEIRQRLAEREPDNAMWQRDMSVSLNKLGDVLGEQGNFEGARRKYEEALEIRQRLAEREPDNAGWQRDMSVSLGRLGDVLGEQGNLAGARRAYERALEIGKRLAEREPDNAGWQRDVSVSLGRLGDMLQKQGNLEGASQEYVQVLEIGKRLAEQESDNVGWQRDVSVSLKRQGNVLRAQGNMKVLRLEMKSFRGFRELSLEFKQPVSVLVGVNGAGKTSILNCLAVLLSQVSSGILSRTGHGRRFTESDIQIDAPYTQNTAEVLFEGKSVRWSLALGRRGDPPQVSSNLTGLKELITRVQERNAVGQYRLPLAIYYPVNRAPDVPSRVRTHHEFGPLSAFDEALIGGGWNFRLFFEWFRKREDLENEQRLRQGANHKDSQLEAVRTAIHRLVPGFSNLRVQRYPQRMIVQKEGTALEVNQLSDGEKCLLAMAGDLGRRLALANPSLSDPLSAEAVVLIDEIELHLHPGWQRMVVEALRRTFPNCQFIMTTHSPQVLSQVPAEAVILLDRFQRKELPAGTLGRDSNSILAEVMGVPERPDASADRIHAIAKMIDDGELTEAREALEALAQQLGAYDSEVVRLKSLIGFLGA